MKIVEIKIPHPKGAPRPYHRVFVNIDIVEEIRCWRTPLGGPDCIEEVSALLTGGSRLILERVHGNVDAREECCAKWARIFNEAAKKGARG